MDYNKTEFSAAPQANIFLEYRPKYKYRGDAHVLYMTHYILQYNLKSMTKRRKSPPDEKNDNEEAKKNDIPEDDDKKDKEVVIIDDVEQSESCPCQEYSVVVLSV